MILADFAHIEGSNEALPGLRAITGGIDKIDFEWLNEDGRGKCRKQYRKTPAMVKGKTWCRGGVHPAGDNVVGDGVWCVRLSFPTQVNMFPDNEISRRAALLAAATLRPRAQGRPERSPRRRALQPLPQLCDPNLPPRPSLSRAPRAPGARSPAARSCKVRK
jgi:hypothetical protein